MSSSLSSYVSFLPCGLVTVYSCFRAVLSILTLVHRSGLSRISPSGRHMILFYMRYLFVLALPFVLTLPCFCIFLFSWPHIKQVRHIHSIIDCTVLYMILLLLTFGPSRLGNNFPKAAAVFLVFFFCDIAYIFPKYQPPVENYF